MTALEFQTLNEPRWCEFERLLDQAERELDPERFLASYRSCCEQLALARARGYPEPLVARLGAMAARAHQIIYRHGDWGFRKIRHLLLNEFPAAVRTHRRYVLLSAAVLMVPTIALGLATYRHPDLILAVVDAKTADSFESMYAPSAHSIGRARGAADDWMMFGFYIMNNVGIALQCYVTGILFGIGSLFFLAFNGAFGGAIGGYVASLGLGGTFFPFVATHSAFELTAIILSGAAGLRLGRAVLLPGRLPRLLAVQNAARETSPIICGAAVMLTVAAALEAFWSSAVWVGPQAKYACAAACWALVGGFFSRRPRGA